MDRDELLTLYDRYHNAVYRLALSFTRSVPDDAPWFRAGKDLLGLPW